MSVQDFTKALQDKSNTTARAQATKMLEELLLGSSELFDPKNPLSLKSGASLFSKGKILVPYRGRDNKEFDEVNLTETFRAEGERQGYTALVLTDTSLLTIFRELSIAIKDTRTPIQAYINYLVENFGSAYKAKHFEFYVKDASNNSVLSQEPSSYKQKKLSNIFSYDSQTGDYTLISGGTITDFRGLNFSHANALTHVASFVHYCRTGIAQKGRPDSIKDIEKEISSLFHRGHIIGQTTGRAELSAKYVSSIKDASGRETNPILLLIQLSKELDIAGAQLSGSKKVLEARIDKDFSGTGPIRMNVGFQLIRDSDGLGNLDIGGLSTSLALISTLQNLLDKLQLDQTRAQKTASTVSIKGSPVAKSVENFAKVLQNFLTKLEKDDAKIYKKFGAVLDGTNDGSFMANLKSSDSLLDYLADNVTSILKTGSPTKNLSVKIPYKKIAETKVAKPRFAKITEEAKKLKASIESTKKAVKAAAIRDTQVSNKYRTNTLSTPNLASLQALLDAQLQHVVAANMGDGRSRNTLNYRTGRLAGSAKVERLSQSREGMITAFYSYMRNPYATFSDGGRQQYPKSRDPKLLISTSIKEIAATKVANRLRAVLV